ncbi:unnamed protein product [Mytilus coruscus]|uniref:Reverse transcriptase zinc-binding domain-containing protein n=1 Tax=Mytilus coruscus TaxID=42192 RepID=A0A6J8BDB0_MYTCO|nr:unnamed protein product [Mytilus coruscus]
MENPSTELFHRLIKRNRGSSEVKTPLLKIDNSEVNDPDKQRGCFMKYFEDLAIPKYKGYPELCTIRHKLISELCSNSTDAFVPFTENEIQSGNNHLHTGKAIDEFDICAEQLKAAGDILVPTTSLVSQEMLMNYNSYVIPKLLYGLEVLPLNNSQLDILKRFHISNLRRFPSLPTRTATCIVYLLLGALPIDAEIHKRHLSLLHNIVTCDNTTIRNLLLRQRAVNGNNCDSFFGRIQEILEFYKLPDIDTLLLEQPSKLAFKYQCKCAIQKTWINLLKSEIDNKSTLKYINAKVLAIGTSHTLWKSLCAMVSEVKMGITKARMVTGTFMTQATRYKFKIENSDHICQLCAIYSEDIKHILLECPALHIVRQILQPFESRSYSFNW